MSFSLFKAAAKSNWSLFVIFLAVLLLYMVMILWMYDPESIEAMNQYVQALPQGMMEAFGYDALATDLISFIAIYFYGFLITMFPLIYCIILANRLVAVLVDRGSMAYLLATPNTRVKVVTTQGIYLASSVTLLLAINAAVGIGLSEAKFPGEMDIPVFIQLNIVTILLTLAISSICFFFSCIVNESKYSLAFGGGIPILFFIINMLKNIGGSSEWLKYLTLYALFDAPAIIAGEPDIVLIISTFAAITIILYSLGIIIFSRRNLYL